MTLRAKLTVGLLAMALVLLVPLLMAVRSLERLQDTTETLRRREFAAASLLGRMRVGTSQLRDAETAMLFLHTPASRAAMEGVVLRIGTGADSLRALGYADEADAVRGALDEVQSLIPAQFDAAVSDRVAEADAISTERMTPAIARLDGIIAAAESPIRERATAAVDLAAEQTARAQRAALVGLVLASLLALAIGVVMWRWIGRPVRALQRGMRAVAAGDFRHQLPLSTSRGDEFGQLASSYRAMTEQLVQYDRLKAEMISVASHELKTPLNVVVGYVQLLKEGIYGPITPKQRDVLETVETQSRTLARLTSQLLDVSRFEAGAGNLDVRAVRLDVFLDELERAFLVLAMQRGIDFRVERGHDLPGFVHWDRDRMNEVLGNLLSNAFKFTSRDGIVSLIVERRDGVVRMKVCDSGAGIPADQLSQIFDKFFQASNQTNVREGTGLGLAIARQIVVAHGGTITVESTVGEGTTFEIVMPAEEVSASRPPALMTPTAVASL